MEAMLEEEMLEKLRGKRKEFPSIAALAKFCKVSPQFMSKVLDGTWHPGGRIAAALGYRQVFAYVKDPNLKPVHDRRQTTLFTEEEHSELLNVIEQAPAPVVKMDW